MTKRKTEPRHSVCGNPDHESVHGDGAGSPWEFPQALGRAGRPRLYCPCRLNGSLVVRGEESPCAKWVGDHYLVVDDRLVPTRPTTYGFAIPSFNTYVHQNTRDRPDYAAFQQACQTLGYKDVKLVDPDAPEDRHVTPWTTTLPPRLVALRTTFGSVRDEVMQLALAEGLRDDDVRTTLISEEPRDEAFHAFWQSIKGEEDEDSGLHPSLF